MSSVHAIGIDVGGTFTDFVYVAGRSVRVLKVPTTAVQSQGIVTGLESLEAAADAAIIHGTTTATNALLEMRGARTALLTTKGFADTLAIGRQNRPQLYRLAQQRNAPLVPKAWRFEVLERLAADGTILEALDEDAVREIVIPLKASGIESLAIVFLFSFLDPAHERRAAGILRGHLPDLSLSLSSEILPEYREYERTATTVINAYVQPLVGRYLRRLSDAVGGRTLWVMQSSGGIIGIRQAARQAARLVLSGPAGGVVGAFGLARQALGTEAPRVLTFDMGGTSTDVSLCPGRIPHTAESTIAGLPLRLPSTWIHTVGAGGGSMARVDMGGVLRVGPESAGAHPGPVCYGRGGTSVTVTDANLVLGRLVAGQFLGGSAAPLDITAARNALQELGARLGMGPEEAALGVLRVANATMERALRRVSLERGHDPRNYVLVPFGGAGPLHACDLASALGIRRLLVPRHPGVLSALGLLMADVTDDASQALLSPLADLAAAPSRLDQAVKKLSGRVLGGESARLEAFLDLRYRGQSYELETPLALPATSEHVEQAGASFHVQHQRRYGYAAPERAVEVTAVRLRGRLPGAKAELAAEPKAEGTSESMGTCDVWFGGRGPTRVPCYAREALRHGHTIQGPALVVQYDTTLVVAPAWRVRIDEWQHAHLSHDDT